MENENKLEYKIKDALIPYSWMFKKWWRHGGNNKESVYVALNSLFYTSLLFLSVSYFSMKSSTGSAKPSEWGKIQTERQQIQQQSKYRQDFYNFDKNKDNVIDSTEFIYRNR